MSNKSRRLYVSITSEFQARVFQHSSEEWVESESWKAIPEAKFRPV